MITLEEAVSYNCLFAAMIIIVVSIPAFLGFHFDPLGINAAIMVGAP